jgi:hypothetical protein
MANCGYVLLFLLWFFLENGRIEIVALAGLWVFACSGRGIEGYVQGRAQFDNDMHGFTFLIPFSGRGLQRYKQCKLAT